MKVKKKRGEIKPELKENEVERKQGEKQKDTREVQGKKTHEERKLERIEKETIRGKVRKEKYRKGNKSRETGCLPHNRWAKPRPCIRLPSDQRQPLTLTFGPPVHADFTLSHVNKDGI